MPLPLPDDLKEILTQTPELEQAYLVGGCVRDWLMGLPVHDYDVEVFGLGYEVLVRALAPWGRTDLVGKSFGVIKLTTARGITHDFTIPRADSKVAAGHKGFEVSFPPDLQPRDAAARRDFTINALMYDPRRNEILDFFEGQSDLQRRILRHTTEAFTEDPLRVLRGMQFASRFELEPAPETVALCRSIKDGFRELAVERVRDEWFKWASQSVQPSRGLRFLVDTEWVEHFPEIAALRGTPQDPEWHPEGDVFVHTCHCCDALARLPGWRQCDPESRIVYMLAALAHDFAKPATTQRVVKEGRERIVSPGHEEAGGAIVDRFLERIHAPRAVRERVIPLVTNHLAHLQTGSDRAVRRLAKRLEPETIDGLCLVMVADHFGRPPKPEIVPDSIHDLQARARALEVQNRAPQPILQGRHLQELGMKSGPAFGVILDAAFEAQLEGKFFDLPQAKQWLEQQPDLPLPPSARDTLAKS